MKMYRTRPHCPTCGKPYDDCPTCGRPINPWYTPVPYINPPPVWIRPASPYTYETTVTISSQDNIKDGSWS
jgi:predicted amidophosphoribosyltransferase